MHSLLAKLNGTEEESIQLEKDLRVFSRLIRKTIKRAKREYNSKQIEKNKNDCRKTWKLINSIINPDSTSNVPDYSIEKEEKVSDKQDIANGFNKFFTGIGKKVVDELGPTPCEFTEFLGRR